MKSLQLTTMLLVLLPLSAFAEWQVVGSPSAPSKQTTKSPATKDSSNFTHVEDPALKFVQPWKQANQFSAQFGSVNEAYLPYHLELLPGSLKTNMERFMKGQPWIMLWNTQYDYEVIGHASINGKNFYDALNKLLENYPVKAIFYKQNNIVTIVPRKNA